uniref:Centromere/kinetochore protein zw10 homolog n=1 Tax=Astyanax mexicanus TaxID=7994 RepID=A0A8B9KMM2_ASTMX
MASFVTEVLASSGKLEKDDLASKISKLSRKVEETKEEVSDMINKKYNEFTPSMEAAETLVDQVKGVSKDIDLLKSCIENEVQKNLHEAVTEYAKLKQQLEKNTAVISMLKHLQDFDTAMEEYHKTLQERKYEAAAKQLEKARASVEALKAWKNSELPLLRSLNSELTVQRENLNYHLGEEWKKLAVWKLPPAKELTGMQSYLTTELHLNGGGSKEDKHCPNHLLPNILQALAIQGELHRKIKLFGQVLLKYVLKPLIMYPSLLVEVGEHLEQGTVLSLQSDENQAEHPAPADVYAKILVVLKTLHKHLFGIHFVDLCLKTVFLFYLFSISIFIIIKTCTDALLFYYVIIISTDLPTCTHFAFFFFLIFSHFFLPNLASAVQLFYTTRNIFHLFYDVVPTYHKDNLLKFPHLAAIQHNNCMFLAHHLLTLGHQFRPYLPMKDGVVYFVDLVPGFRKLGAQCFVAQMNVQKAEMLERLSTARNFSNLDDEDNYSAASKAVRQVIHQLKRLGKVWQDVLPVNIYCKSMGTLLNTAISEMISKIMMLVDISTEDGERLHTLCQTILEEGSLVFTPLPDENKNRKYQEEVPVYVKKWMTFKELSVVLHASLQEIVDRWAEGKGPLAQEFSSNEMKSLIRALFQNTDRRAIALTKIK